MPLTSAGEFHENDNEVAVRDTFTKLTGALGTADNMNTQYLTAILLGLTTKLTQLNDKHLNNTKSTKLFYSITIQMH